MIIGFNTKALRIAYNTFFNGVSSFSDDGLIRLHINFIDQIENLKEVYKIQLEHLEEPLANDLLIKDEYYPIDLSIILDNLLELYSNVVSSFDLKEDTIESDYIKVHKVLLANTMASDSVEEEINGRLKNNEPVLTLEEQDELNDQFYDYYIYTIDKVANMTGKELWVVYYYFFKIMYM